MRVLRGIILIFVLTAVSWNCGAAYASQKDKDVREVLDSPGVVEKFKKNQGNEPKRSKDNESPLVKEAKSFALYLNPPAKVEKRPAKVNEDTKSIVKEPTNVSAKFKIIGTSYSESNPSTSLALLDITGKGLRWIRQGETVGHLVIEEVKPGGTIVVRDGKNTSEMTTDKPVQVSLLKGGQPDTKGLPGQIESTLSTSSDPGSKTSGGVKTAAPKKSRPKLTEEEIKQQEVKMKQLMDQVGQMLKASGGDANSPRTAGEKDGNEIQQQELVSEPVLEQVDQMVKENGDDANSIDIPDENKPAVKDEVDTNQTDEKQTDEKPLDETSAVGTVEDASGLMEELSAKLEQIKSDKDSTNAEDIEKSVQQDAEYLRKAVLKLKATEVSPEDKEKLISLDRDLARVQQDIRRSQSRNRIEKARNKSRR